MSVTPTTQTIDLRSTKSAFTSVKNEQLFSAGSLSVVRMEIPAGEETPHHSATDVATLHCISGQMVVVFDEEEVQLDQNQVILLDAHRPHVVKAKTDSVLLITMQVPDLLLNEQSTTDPNDALDSVDEAAAESFPASDPPAFNSTK